MNLNMTYNEKSSNWDYENGYEDEQKDMRSKDLELYPYRVFGIFHKLHFFWKNTVKTS